MRCGAVQCSAMRCNCLAAAAAPHPSLVSPCLLLPVRLSACLFWLLANFCGHQQAKKKIIVAAGRLGGGQQPTTTNHGHNLIASPPTACPQNEPSSINSCLPRWCLSSCSPVTKLFPSRTDQRDRVASEPESPSPWSPLIISTRLSTRVGKLSAAGAQ